MMYKLALFDIDGTLFDEKKGLYPDSAVEALKKLHENGILIGVATGRPPFSALTLRQAGIPLDYLVYGNGHLVLDSRGQHSGKQNLSAGTFPGSLGVLPGKPDRTALEVPRLHLCIPGRSGV